MKKLIALMMVLAMMFVAVPGLAEMTEFTYVVPSTVENLEHSPFHIAQRLLAEEGYTLNIMEAFGTTDIRMVATNQAQFCGPGPMYILSGIAEGLPIKTIMAYDAINIWGMAVLSDSEIQSFDDMIDAQEKSSPRRSSPLASTLRTTWNSWSPAKTATCRSPRVSWICCSPGRASAGS